MKYIDYQGIQIALREERWRHINERHPETILQGELLKETICKPNFTQEGTKSELRRERLALKIAEPDS